MLDGLFTEEELDKSAETQNTPVTCLGKTFSNDIERKKYFKDELRSKLSELKKSEGYPLADDESVINYSNPPYYTVCPNPWIKEIIEEWGKNKNLIPNRLSNFDVKEPYAADVSVGKNNPIYLAHSYHTKVPHPAIMRYILHYTQPGDIIFDGFSGTGMTGVAAAKCGCPESELKSEINKDFSSNNYPEPKWGSRKAICSDLSPFASFISYNYNSPANISSFSKNAERIIQSAEKELLWMYETKHINGEKGLINYTIWSDVFICPDCGGEIVYYDAAVDLVKNEIKTDFVCPHCGAIHNKDQVDKDLITTFDKALNKTINVIKNIPVYISYTYKGKRYEKKPDESDLELIRKIDSMDLPCWVPTDEMPVGAEGSRNQICGINYVHQFFTKRNLIAYSYLWEHFDSDSKFLLTAIMFNASKLYRWRLNGKGGYLNGTYYIASTTQENNCFNIARAKIKDLSRALFANDYNVNQVISLTNSNLPDNSIDYIFTDPPFGGNIMYSELNFIHESWMKIKTSNKTEAVSTRYQNKGIFEYGRLMQKCFEEYYRVLKPGKWITVEFSNTSASVWNSIQVGLNKAGFVIANVATLDKKQGSFKAVTTPTAVKQDLVITCYKPTEEMTQSIKSNDGITNTWNFIEELLQHLPIPTVCNYKTTAVIERSPKVLFDRLITYFLMKGLPVPLDASDFQDGLRARYLEEDGMFFNSEQLTEYHELKKKNNIEDQLSLFTEIIENESDAIQWLKDKLQEKPLKYQDIQPDYRKAYAISRKGEVQIELQEVLSENFIQNPDNTWRVPNLNEVKDREILRTKSLLSIFNEYVETITRTNRALKDVRLEAIKAGFKQCYNQKNFKMIVLVGEKIPENLLTEDETLLNYFDIACSKI